MSTKSFSTKVKKISDKAVLPTRAHETDSGWDLTVTGIDKIKGDTIFFKTGLQVKPPSGHYFEIHIRSSCSELPIMLANSVGIIDEGYRNELIVAIRVLHQNIGLDEKGVQYPSGMVKMLDARPISIKEVSELILAKKPKIAQLILRKRIDTFFSEVSELDTTERGDGGFGSTG
jgi:dUTP pyrophosphatase